jgi:hypothetical protein
MKDASYVEVLFMARKKQITSPLQRPACDHSVLTLIKERIAVSLE